MPQHRQHFNLTDVTKQRLDALTARRYPGRQRRQSQLVEDLIAEAYKKECETPSPDDATLEEAPLASPPIKKIAESGVGYIIAQAVSEPDLCFSCQREVQPGWKHCVYCGVALVRLCPRCGVPRAEVEGACFCFACGGPLE